MTATDPFRYWMLWVLWLNRPPARWSPRTSEGVFNDEYQSISLV